METSKNTTGKRNTSTANSLFKQAKSKLLRFRKSILRELNHCKETGKLIGIACQALGEGIIRSSVEEIYRSGTDEIVVLKWFDANNFASQTHVFLDEILDVRHIDNKIKRNSLTIAR